MTEVFSPRPDKIHAIIVGIEHYPHLNRNLNGPAHDAVSFMKWLIDNKVSEDNIYLYLSLLPEDKDKYKEKYKDKDITYKEVNHNNIVIKLHELAQEKDDLIFIFWGGHGVMPPTMNDHWLVYGDASKYNIPYLSLNELLIQLKSNNHSHHICFIDACATALPRPAENRLSKLSISSGDTLLKPPEPFIFFATGPGEKAQNPLEIKGGLFSETLMKYLNQLTDIGCLVSDWEKLVDFIKTEFEQYSDIDQHPYSIYPGPVRQRQTYLNYDNTLIESINKAKKAQMNEEFCQLCENVAIKDLKTAYSLSLPLVFEPMRLDWQSKKQASIRDVLVQLWEFDSQDDEKTHPLLKFTEYIRHESIGIKQEIKQWQKKAIQQLRSYGNISEEYLDSTKQLIIQLSLELKELEAKPLYLQIAMDFQKGTGKKCNDDASFYIRLWLRQGENQEPLCDSGGYVESPFTMELPKLLGVAMNKIEAKHPNHLVPFTFEFILPSALLLKDVETIKIYHSESIQREIRRTYRTVVRDIERQKILGIRDKWWTKWCKFTDVCNDDTLEALIDTSDWDDDEICYLGTTTKLTEEQLRDMLYEGGIPIAILARQSFNEPSQISEFKKMLMELLKKSSLVNLPQMVYTKRKSGKDPHYKLMSNFTLFWDDCSRLLKVDSFSEQTP